MADQFQLYGGVPRLTVSTKSYVASTVPLGGEADVMSSVGVITIVNECESFSGLGALSVTVTVNVELPLPVGVPESVPSLFNVKPAGNAPAATLQLNGAEPPSALKANPA